jgi:hypothetical protein
MQDVVLLDLDYRRKNCDVLYVSITLITAVFLFAMAVSILSESTSDHCKADVTYV